MTFCHAKHTEVDGVHDLAWIQINNTWVDMAVANTGGAPHAPDTQMVTHAIPFDPGFNGIGTVTFYFDTVDAVQNHTFGWSVDNIVIYNSQDDCNGNGVPDALDIVAGTSVDLNDDGIPDDCDPGSPYCWSTPNSTSFHGVIGSVGSSMALDENLTLVAWSLPANEFAYFLMSATPDFVPFFGGSSGHLCLGQPIIRFNAPNDGGEVLNTGAGGATQFTLAFDDLPQGSVFQPGDTWHFQLWHRVFTTGPTSNTTNGLAVTFQ